MNRDLKFFVPIDVTHSCDPEAVMKIAMIAFAVVLVAALVFGDYKWRQWMAARRRDRQ
jgi:hypothetical protein